MKIESTSIICELICCCDAQFLSDHHNRENELLISAYPSLIKSDLLWDFWSDVRNSDKIPLSISDDEIEAAILEMLGCLLHFERVLHDIEGNEDARIWAVLSW